MKKRMRSTVESTVAILALLVMVPTFVWAVEGFRDRGFRQGPPQEAVDACAGKKEGDVVRFNTPVGDDVSGTCREIRGKLIAVPEGGPPRGREGMGPEENFILMVKALDLTKEQAKQVKSILDVERKRVSPLMQHLADNREKLRQVMEAEPFDEPTIRALATGQEKARVEMIVSRARVKSRILALLIPEQRKLARKFRSILPDLSMRFRFHRPKADDRLLEPQRNL